MKKIAILGIGRIGDLTATLLNELGDYYLYLIDQNFTDELRAKFMDKKQITFVSLDVTFGVDLKKTIDEHAIDAVISCLPYFLNREVAQVVAQTRASYYDVTEDVETSQFIKETSQKSSNLFAPQCGLAPGLISIIANSIANKFDEVDTIKMRVGALPIAPSNILNYALTWSTDGLINQYANKCKALENHEITYLEPLEGLESITIDGMQYECFNTSGGIGTLADSHKGKTKHLTYKTIRYPGHCEIIKLLMEDLRLKEERDTLKKILEKALPKIKQDVVLIYVSVLGRINGELYEEHFVRKFYGKSIAGSYFTALQITTAVTLAAVVHESLSNANKKYIGFLTQEMFSFEDLANGPFGEYYV